MHARTQLLAALVTLASAPAAAQAVRVEIFGGVTGLAPAQRSVYDAPYTPSRVVSINTLFQQPDPRSSARQSLTLDATPGAGVGFGVNVWHGRWGGQLLVDRASVDLAGENGPHEVDLTYTTIDIPTPNPVVRTAAFRFNPPDTRGTLTALAVSINGLVQVAAWDRVAIAASGGLTRVRVGGDAERLGARAGWLGGHGVLFTELYEFRMAIPTRSTIGVNVGGDLALAVTDRLSVVVDIRLFAGRDLRGAPRFDRMLSANIVATPLEVIERFLDPPPLVLDPGFVRVLAGLRWRPW